LVAAVTGLALGGAAPATTVVAGAFCAAAACAGAAGAGCEAVTGAACEGAVCAGAGGDTSPSTATWTLGTQPATPFSPRTARQVSLPI
jgi:hypothetical protein